MQSHHLSESIAPYPTICKSLTSFCPSEGVKEVQKFKSIYLLKLGSVIESQWRHLKVGGLYLTSNVYNAGIALRIIES